MIEQLTLQRTVVVKGVCRCLVLTLLMVLLDQMPHTTAHTLEIMA